MTVDGSHQPSWVTERAPCPPLSETITLIGLIFETAAGLRRRLAPGLEERIGVGGQAFEILVRLARSPGGALRMSDLATQTGLTPSGLTRAMDRLTAEGLADRQACESDRRGAFAVLTDDGRVRMAEALELHERDITSFLDGLLSDEEEQTLVELLARLRDRVHPGATAGAGCASALDLGCGAEADR